QASGRVPITFMPSTSQRIVEQASGATGNCRRGWPSRPPPSGSAPLWPWHCPTRLVRVVGELGYIPRAELERSRRLAALVGSLEGGLGALEVPFLLEQQAEVVRTSGLAPLVGSLVGGAAARDVAALLEQYAEVGRSPGVTSLIGTPEGVLG